MSATPATLENAVADVLQTPHEERLNTLTHGAAATLSLIGFALLVPAALTSGSMWATVGAVIYGLALVSLYLTSTIYHALPSGRAKELFRSFDHMGVYLLIAGTYTVICLTALRESVGWGLFAAQWGMAAAGIALKSIYGPDRFELISTIGYVVMGWMVVPVFGEVMELFSVEAFGLLVAGGVCYTLGVPFFLLDQKRRFFHTIWHLFVIAGSVCHFLMAWLYLLA